MNLQKDHLHTFSNSTYGKFTLAYFIKKNAANSFLRFSIISVCIYAALLTLIWTISKVEGTLHLTLKNGGRGLLEHWGTWSQAIGYPILLILAFYLLNTTFEMLAHVDRLVNRIAESTTPAAGNESPKRREEIELNFDLLKSRIREIIYCETLGFKLVHLLMMLIGALALIANIQNTRRAAQVYGQDVWDSSAHIGGYIIGKIFLGFSWIFLTPTVVYFCLSAGVAVYLCTNFLLYELRYRPSFFESDGCGGLRPLGKVMLAVLYINAPFVGIIVAHIYTHTNFYETLWFATVLVSGTIICEFILPFYKVHTYMRNIREDKMRDLEKQIVRQEEKIGDESSKFSYVNYLSILASTELYKQVAKVSTWPYLPRDTLKAATPLLPLVLAILKELVSR